MSMLETIEETVTTIPTLMRAAAINRFGGPEEIVLRELPVPRIADDEILIRVKAAGVGPWDPMEREGKFHEMMKVQPHFPLVLGSDGAGKVVAVGKDVDRFRIGDMVYAYGFMNPKGGFYAEYAAVTADNASHVPDNMTMEQAAGLPVDAITAFCGLESSLRVKSGETVLIYGASGGVGHLAVQLARRMGARIFAVASGNDGVALAKSLGADVAVDGKRDGVAEAVREFAPDGIDAALVTANGSSLDEALATLRNGGRVAYPNGVWPEPTARAGIKVESYDGVPDVALLKRLDGLIGNGPFTVNVARTFFIDQAAEAHRALKQHYLGKLVLRTTP